MVLAINIYKFELNQMESGEINPVFNLIVSEVSQENRDFDFSKIITANDQFAIFFNHTTGLSFKDRQIVVKNTFVGRLKETPYKVISFYHQEIDDSKYLIISFFRLHEDIDLFEAILQQMRQRIEKIFGKMMQGNYKDIRFMTEIEKELKTEIKYAFFQMDRLSNLTKIQKVALIFTSPERVKTLELLREGPMSRRYLLDQLEMIKDHPNLDIILNPFVELNLVRREWAKGIRDAKSGVLQGEGEYLFLLKDITLIRKQPSTIIEDVKKNEYIGDIYKKALSEFFDKYEPFQNLNEESKNLGKFLLDPDIYDFLTLLHNKVYPLAKIPKITSQFASFEAILKDLENAGVIRILKDKNDREWVCLISEITPIVVFPEFIIEKINKRVILKSDRNKQVTELSITPEIAKKGLDLLDSTYNEKIEF